MLAISALATICCIGVPCELNNGGCEHVCTNIQSGVSCSCTDGYQLINNQNCTGKQIDRTK